MRVNTISTIKCQPLKPSFQGPPSSVASSVATDVLSGTVTRLNKTGDSRIITNILYELKEKVGSKELINYLDGRYQSLKMAPRGIVDALKKMWKSN